MVDAHIRLDPYITTSDGKVDNSEVSEFQNFMDLSGEGMHVAVMDSGIDKSHPYFDGVTIEHEVDFTGSGKGDDVGHGTACAGIYAQNLPDVTLSSVRIFGDSGRTGWATIEDAYDWLIDHGDEIDVVNMSWGTQKIISVIDNKHNRMVDAGIRDATAAGNTGNRGGSPATADKAFSAGAVTIDGEVTNFSSYNPNRDNPDVSAVGKNVLLARADGTSMGRVVDEDHVVASGTSFAAPIMGVITTDLLRRGEGKTGVVGRLENNSRPIPGTPREGQGIADHKNSIADEGGDRPDISTTGDVIDYPFLPWDLLRVEHEGVFQAGPYNIEKEGDKITVTPRD